MAGHSKWANIKHRKNATDAKRGKIFTRLIREISIAAREDGGTSNPRLRLAIEKARTQNMPNENIERAIKRGRGELDGVVYEEVRYEGYAAGGIPIIVDCMTDNRARTVADVRYAFNKHNGNLGTDGSVAYLFQSCGLVFFEKSDELARCEEEIIEKAIEAGALDFKNLSDGSLLITTTPAEFEKVVEEIKKIPLEITEKELTMKLIDEIEVEDKTAADAQRLIDALESIDDVQNVYSAID